MKTLRKLGRYVGIALLVAALPFFYIEILNIEKNGPRANFGLRLMDEIAAIIGGTLLIWWGRVSATGASGFENWCEHCYINAETRPLCFRQITGLFFFHEVKTVSGFLCKSCGKYHFRYMTLNTFYWGWWSLAGFFLSPLFIIENVFNYADSRVLKDVVIKDENVAAEIPTETESSD